MEFLVPVNQKNGSPGGTSVSIQPRMPLTPFNVTKTWHYNVQQISCIEAFEAQKTPAVCSPACSFSFKSHECYRDQWGGMNSLFGDCHWTQCPTGAASNYHPHLPAKPCGVFGEVQKGHGCPLYFHRRLDPQDYRTTIQSSEQAVFCIQRSWEMRHRCLPASSHGMQASHPEARGKRQSLVFVSS